MPRTIEHIVETHRIAAQRRAAGLPHWKHTIKLGDIWRNEDLGFEERRDRVVARLRRSPWLRDRDEVDPLLEIVEHLAHAEDFDEFNDWWDEIYDAADIERVWIDTH